MTSQEQNFNNSYVGRDAIQIIIERYIGREVGELDYKHRKEVLRKVISYTDKVLSDPIHCVEVDLDFLDVSDKYAPSRLRSQPSHSERPVIPRNPLGSIASLIDYFADEGQELLVLGDGGAGKTTQLLRLTNHLARELLDRHVVSPIPIYLHLHEWRNRTWKEWVATYTHRQSMTFRGDPFFAWLIDEITDVETYNAQAELVKEWITNKLVILVLDGLNEVPWQDRIQCVEAINRFHARFKGLPVVVSCRTEEYNRLFTRVLFRDAISIEPLNLTKVFDSLNRNPNTRHIGKKLRSHTTLHPLMTNPFFLNIAITVIEEENFQRLIASAATELQVRDAILAAYVGKALSRKEPTYKPNDLLIWTVWLAKQMKEDERKEVTISDIDGTWLPGRMGRLFGWFKGRNKAKEKHAPSDRGKHIPQTSVNTVSESKSGEQQATSKDKSSDQSYKAREQATSESKDYYSYRDKERSISNDEDSQSRQAARNDASETTSSSDAESGSGYWKWFKRLLIMYAILVIVVKIFEAIGKFFKWVVSKGYSAFKKFIRFVLYAIGLGPKDFDDYLRILDSKNVMRKLDGNKYQFVHDELRDYFASLRVEKRRGGYEVVQD